MKFRWLQTNFVAIILSSLLLFGAFAFPALRWVVFVGLVPWFYTLRNLNSKESLKSGFWFGVFYYAMQMSWLYPFILKWTHNFFLPILPVLLVGILGGFYFSIIGWLIQRSYHIGWHLMVPLMWAVGEILRSFAPAVAFPWGLIASPLSVFPTLIQHAALGGIFLVSAWVVLVNVLIVQLLLKKPIWKELSIVLLFLGFSLQRYFHPPLETIEKKIMLGQTGVDMAYTPPYQMQHEIKVQVDKIFEVAQQQQSDLLILPEGLTQGGDTIPPYISFSSLPPVPTIFGGVRGTKPSYQSCFAYENGKWEYADKTRLVIFGEYVPFREYLTFLKGFRLPGGDLVPGDRVKAFEINGMRVGPLLCFEGLFPEIAYQQTLNDANLLAVMSMDDFYMDTLAIEQLAEASVWRAVESGLPLVRCGSEGVTMAIDSRGNVLKRAPLKVFDPLLVTVKIPKCSDAFPYRWMFIYVSVLAPIAVVLVSLYRKV